MRHILLLIFFFIYLSALGQDNSCRTNELFTYLKIKGLASEGDQEFIRCIAIVKEPNGDGVYQFGLNETDTFTHFYIMKDNKIKFVDSSKIENTLTEVSAYLSESSFSIEGKIRCYETILQIIKDERLSYPWLLQEKD